MSKHYTLTLSIKLLLLCVCVCVCVCVCKDTFVAFLAHRHIEIMPVTPNETRVYCIMLTLQNNLEAKPSFYFEA